jgi:hypothetical protein
MGAATYDLKMATSVFARIREKHIPGAWLKEKRLAAETLVSEVLAAAKSQGVSIEEDHRRSGDKVKSWVVSLGDVRKALVYLDGHSIGIGKTENTVGAIDLDYDPTQKIFVVAGVDPEGPNALKSAPTLLATSLAALLEGFELSDASKYAKL